MTISATSQGLKPGVVTSSNRPANPFDGMMIYETDTNLVRIWNGTAWKTLAYSDYTSGSVIQVVSATKTDTQTFNTTTYTDITGLSVSITPTSTSSKVFIKVDVTAHAELSVTQGYLRLMRDSTAIAIGDASGSRVQASACITFTDNGYHASSSSFSYLDSPSTTLSTTYKVQTRDESARAVYINRSQNDNNGVAGGRFISTITAMEIAG